MAKQKKNKAESAMSDIRLGIGFLIFSVLFFAATFFFRVVKIPNTFDAAFMPRILSVIVFGCALYLALRGFKAYSQCSEEDKKALSRKEKGDRAGNIRMILVILDLVAAAALFKKLGFILTMPWMMFILLMIIEKKENRNIPLFLALSIIAPIVIFFVFYYGFSQLLPMGILRPFLSQFL